MMSYHLLGKQLRELIFNHTNCSTESCLCFSILPLELEELTRAPIARKLFDHYPMGGWCAYLQSCFPLTLLAVARQENLSRQERSRRQPQPLEQLQEEEHLERQ